jgi:hypothetical protein
MKMEIIKVRKKTEADIVFASMEDMKSFFDQINNGQGVIFDYVDEKDSRNGEYISPSILTLISDGKVKITSKEKKQQENAKEIRLIEKDQAVGLALASALQAANIKYIGSGQPKDFMDLFSVAGGMSAGGSIGTMLGMIKETDPELHKSVISAIENVSKKDKGFSLDNIDAKTVEMAMAFIKTTKPEVYKQIKELTKDEEKTNEQ